VNVSCRDLRYDDGTHLIETVPGPTMYKVSVGFSALWRMWTPAFSLTAILISSGFMVVSLARTPNPA
jgi:hypothetical protein